MCAPHPTTLLVRLSSFEKPYLRQKLPVSPQGVRGRGAGERGWSRGGGKPLAQAYREAGLNMLADRAAFADGSTSVEAGLMELLQRMQTGRLKVFAHLADWFEEFRLYHRKDGRVVKQADDLMDATRYGIMCLRHARADERLLPPPPAAEGGAADSWMG